MSFLARGSFEVKMTPQEGRDPALGGFLLDKVFHGDLEAASLGAMLTAAGVVQGSAGYVAIERVTGVLQGRTGAFSLMHTGIMDRGQPSLTIVVAPDSGDGELTGIRGTMSIQIAAGQHSYELDYTLPE